MKFKLSDKTSRFAKRTLADFSEKMIAMLADMPLEEMSVQKICDICNYPRSTFYNYFDDIYDLMDYCWIAIMKDMDIVTIYNGVDTKLYKYNDKYNMRKKYKLDQYKKYILLISADINDPRKGFKDIVDTLNKVENKESFPTSTQPKNDIPNLNAVLFPVVLFPTKCTIRVSSK